MRRGGARASRSISSMGGGGAKRPGIGIKLDMAQVEAAHAPYREVGGTARDDAVAMLYLVDAGG
ncbi:hypothetical protein NBN09_20210 [Burkholderia lata]